MTYTAAKNTANVNVGNTTSAMVLSLRYPATMSVDDRFGSVRAAFDAGPRGPVCDGPARAPRRSASRERTMTGPAKCSYGYRLALPGAACAPLHLPPAVGDVRASDGGAGARACWRCRRTVATVERSVALLLSVMGERGFDAAGFELDAHLIDDLGFDSFDAVDMLVMIEARSGCVIDPEELFDVETVRDFLAVVERALDAAR